MTYHKPTYIAEATVSINAPIAAVWHALRDPELIRQYMFGAEVDTDWREGEPIEIGRASCRERV